MRLTADQVRSIVDATRALAGPDTMVRLFGSRLHDELRGGDIDLLVECASPVARPVWLAAQITARLQRALGDRKIDVLVLDPATALEPVHRVARAEGLVLQA
jgi:predicted nucleotidyltransferase